MENLTTLPPNLNNHWSIIAPLLTIRNEEEYEQAIKRLNDLINLVGTNKEHPLYNLLDTLGTLIEVYEAERYSIPNCSGSDVLAYLIEEHGLNLSDLPEIGTSETIEKILNKKQPLNLSQIQQLAKLFHVQPQVFLD
ncbi:MAG: transcriptional regulator [Crocosphaera sp.]|nr:transcriptional regulator [Crocosphaera sp.]